MRERVKEVNGRRTRIGMPRFGCCSGAFRSWRRTYQLLLVLRTVSQDRCYVRLPLLRVSFFYRSRWV